MVSSTSVKELLKPIDKPSGDAPKHRSPKPPAPKPIADVADKIYVTTTDYIESKVAAVMMSFGHNFFSGSATPAGDRRQEVLDQLSRGQNLKLVQKL